MKGVYSPSNYEQCILSNFLYDGNHNPHLFVIANSTLKEYEIIMLIYNKIMQDAKKISPSQACQKLNPPLFNLPSLTPPQFCPTPNFLDPSASIKLPLPNKDVCIYMIMGDSCQTISETSLLSIDQMHLILMCMYDLQSLS